MWRLSTSMEKTLLAIIGSVAFVGGFVLYYPRMSAHFLQGLKGVQYYVHPWEGFTIGVLAWSLAMIISGTPLVTARSTWILALSVVLGWIFLLGVTLVTRGICQLVLGMLTFRSLYGFPVDSVPNLIQFYAELLVIYTVGAFLPVAVVVLVDILLLRVLSSWRITY